MGVSGDIAFEGAPEDRCLQAAPLQRAGRICDRQEESEGALS